MDMPLADEGRGWVKHTPATPTTRARRPRLQIETHRQLSVGSRGPWVQSGIRGGAKGAFSDACRPCAGRRMTLFLSRISKK